MAIEKITLGAGCFWGVQYLLNSVEGVKNTRVGYAAGDSAEPNYRDVCSGIGGHAEVVLVEFDNSIVSLESVLSYFWRLHNPTEVNRQGPDVGVQYISIILC